MRDPLDLPSGVGQRSASYRFELVDGRTGVRRGPVTPLRDTTPSLVHDVTGIIVRRVESLTLDVADARRLRPLTDRVAISMVVGGREYPLGRYMIGDAIQLQTSTGSTAPLVLFDEMFVVDQELETGFEGSGQRVDRAVLRLLAGLPIGEVQVDWTDRTSVSSWSPGNTRGMALRDLARQGGFFLPWFNHGGRLRLMGAFEPATRRPTIDLDASQRVFRGSVARGSELLTAPNRFVVVSNDPGTDVAPIVGVYDVPSSAPHSIAQRGFVLPKVVEAQLPSQVAVDVYARTLGIQQTAYETVELSTPPDPRHDGYDVVRWDGLLWLETGWTMQLAAGGEMRHTLRRAYPDTGGDDL
ncbi:hypothetical protein [Micromonospora endophytica]|uniref:Uncharacterized protein n=1 Tax=Micromonospora endophytica TaxID=515350 RepID=A0A2W2BXS9_9ACTN|nr:hypothetical protein [Micromonospora endophytica]PZF92101.1 hypothetical protein C1I93_20030 [Micromonospora endophytica]RIW42868.1 hypothetical protein D3H59_21825 [Micromonospora endophytica]